MEMEPADAYQNCAFVSLDDKAVESVQAMQCVIKEQLCLPAKVIVYVKVIDSHQCSGGSRHRRQKIFPR